jgi:hypothetical protein
MATWVWVVIAIAVVVVVALVAVGARKNRTAALRDRFGSEYDLAVENSEDRRAAEADLRARERQRAQFDVKPLPEATRLRFAGEWRDLQEGFLDQPAQAAAAADTLITRVMEARGYPMKDFDAQAELVSVDHPDTVENYRFAHAVQQRSLAQQASTEDLREALLRYRSLFDELLRPEGNGAAGATTDQARPASSDTDYPAPAGHDGYDDDNYDDVNAALVADHAASGAAGRSAPDTDDGSAVTDPGSRASLLEGGELQSITMRWKDIQAEFVDEPSKAVQEADALVAELMQRLAAMFATERAELETRWAGGSQVSTEDLRQGLRRYRSFFERLLAA